MAVVLRSYGCRTNFARALRNRSCMMSEFVTQAQDSLANSYVIRTNFLFFIPAFVLPVWLPCQCRTWIMRLSCEFVSHLNFRDFLTARTMYSLDSRFVITFSENIRSTQPWRFNLNVLRRVLNQDEKTLGSASIYTSVSENEREVAWCFKPH